MIVNLVLRDVKEKQEKKFGIKKTLQLKNRDAKRVKLGGFYHASKP